MTRPPTKKEKLFDLWYRPDYYDRHWAEDPATGCWNWNGPSHRQGYGMIGAWKDGTMEGIMTTTHRIAARKKLGRAIDSGEWIVHTCSNPRCVNPDHLEVGDRKRIHEIMRKNGRYNQLGRPHLGARKNR